MLSTIYMLRTLKLSKTSPRKLFPFECITLYATDNPVISAIWVSVNMDIYGCRRRLGQISTIYTGVFGFVTTTCG